MSIAKLAKWVMAGAMLGTLMIGQVGAAKPAKPAEPPTPVAVKLDNATCEGCHDGSKDKLEIVGSNGEKRALFVVKPDKLAKSVHAEMSCVSCHKEIIDANASHKKAEGVAKPNCVTCHEALWETAKKENLTKEKERLGIVVKNIEAYKKSFHALPGKEDKTKPKAYCEDCHNTHIFNIPSRGTSKRLDWHLTVPNVCGEKCHSDELEEFASSVHGKELLDKKNPKAPACIDCHTAHDIFSTSAEQFKVN
ncbi:MAG TPA: cytochrome C, partial [Gallionella sp.]